MTLLAIPSLLLLLSLLGYLLARRGRRVDDHPLCRQCGFDLTGKPDDSTRCAECGADVTAKNAIRIGHRSPFRRWRMLASFLLVLSIGWLGLAGYAFTHSDQFQRAKPIWWLLRETKEPDPNTRDAAIAEIARRVSADELSEASAADVVSAGLSHQGNSAQAWLPAWGAIVENLHAKGRVNEEDWRTYLKQAVAGIFQLKARTYIRRGDLGFFEMRLGKPRAYAAAICVIPPYANPTSIGGVPLQLDKPRRSPAEERSGPIQVCPPKPYTLGRWDYFVLSANHPIWQQLSDGTQPCLIQTTVQVYNGLEKQFVKDWEKRPSIPVAVTLSAPIELHTASDPHFRLRTDASMRSAMQACIQIDQVTQTDEDWRLQAHIIGCPMPMAFRATIHCRGKDVCQSPQWYGILQSVQNERFQMMNFRKSDLPELPDQADIVLTPALDAPPYCGIMVNEIWGEVIVIPDVKLKSLAEKRVWP